MVAIPTFPHSPLSLLERVKAEQGRRDLREFVKQAWHVIEPTTPYVPGWHIDALIDHLEAVNRGDIRNLLINIPPRHAKSLIVSVFWPMWSWIDTPAKRWLCSSYALSLAIRDNRKCKILIESDWFQARYGNCFYLSKDQKAKGRFENNHRGYRMAVSVGSAATGEGGDALLVDDPHNVLEAYSDTKREEALLWWDTTMSSRLNDPKKGSKVIIMQRIHERDLSGHVLEQGGYTHLCLPAEYEPSRRCYTEIGWEDPRTEEGQLLWPAQVGHRELEKLKVALGSSAYAAQYQQSPSPLGGDIFKQEHFVYFTIHENHYTLHTRYGDKNVARAKCWLFATVDLAASLKTTADYTVISTWAATPDNELLLVEQQRDHMTGPEIQRAIALCYQRYRHNFVEIEATAFQLTMTQELIVRWGIPVRPFTPHKDKVSRAISASVFYEAGQVYHLQFAEYLTIMEKELLNFPKGAHDDVVDTVSRGCEVLFNPNQPNMRLLGEESTEEILPEKPFESTEQNGGAMERGIFEDW